MADIRMHPSMKPNAWYGAHATNRVAVRATGPIAATAVTASTPIGATAPPRSPT